MSLSQPTGVASAARAVDARAVRGAGSLEERYRSLLVIGKGGMGSVEVALERGAGGFERIVALKRLLPEGARDPRHKEMFLREARLAALLAHPNVVHAFAFGELHGELFLAMEYVEGEPLSRVLSAAREKEGRVAPAIVAHVLAAVCDGLHAAHELKDVNGHALNVVHRDLSPQNVMIAYEGHVKLLDFGVAKFDTAQSNTKTGEVKGKMAYMSPEQALGDPLDRRSDLFSLGAVLFECLSGQRMWGTGTDLELMRKLALEEPRRLDLVMPDAPTALVDLQARLVARDRTKRPATARDVADELRGFLAAKYEQPDTRGVRAMMQRLFAGEAARQRDALTAALEAAAPAHVETLRKTLDPNRPIRVPEVATAEHATLSDGSSDGASLLLVRRAKRGARVAWIVAAVIAALIATAGAFAFTRTTTPPVASRATSPTSPATPVPVPATTAATATTTPSATTPPLPTSLPTSLPTAARPIFPAAPTVAPPPPSATKLPHVDPKPF